MSSNYDFPEGYGPPPALDSNARAGFISRTYLHLFGAISAFTFLQVWLFQSGYAETIAELLLRVKWLMVLGVFMIVGWLASRTAHNVKSTGAQYMALGVFVAVEAIIFVPLLYIANTYAPGAIQSAAVVTMMGFTGLTAIAFVTRKDFSFLRGVIAWVGVLALVGIASSVLFGFALGTWFSVTIVGLAGASILYDTSNIIHHYEENMHVAASLQLFAAVALMFWYVLQIFMSRD